MKKLVLLLGVLISTNAFALGGGTVGNGGNEIALDFIQTAQRVLQTFGGYLKTYPELKGKNLKETLNKAQVLSSRTPLYVEKNSVKQECTAMNFPQQLTIAINEKRWSQLTEPAIKEALALHELLGLVGVEQTGNYYISKKYLIKNGIHCAEGLCEDSKRSIGKKKDIFCRLNNHVYPNPQTYNYPFDCTGASGEFVIYCDLWIDPIEFGHNKLDVYGGVFEKRDKVGGVLNYSGGSEGSMRCTYEDVGNL